jgi:predicted polyphosphate/ATP-dependent NAD kinase
MYRSLSQSVPVIVVAGGDGNAASDEAAALKSQML